MKCRGGWNLPAKNGGWSRFGNVACVECENEPPIYFQFRASLMPRAKSLIRCGWRVVVPSVLPCSSERGGSLTVGLQRRTLAGHQFSGDGRIWTSTTVKDVKLLTLG